MPIAFESFRLLNGGSRLRNESTKSIYAKGRDEEPAIEIPPGAEADLPTTLTGETLLQVPQDDPPPSGG